MPNDKLKDYLHLHFLVFIAGFTAILGELITISSIDLVWYRMSIAGGLMFVFIRLTNKNLNIDKRTLIGFLAAGVIIALHWVTFFESINQSNISIALSMFSSGAFFASFIEPIFFKRRIRAYEIVCGILVIIGVLLITKSELHYINGIILGLFSALFSTLFAVINGKYIKSHKASVISFYEFVSGVVFLSVFVLIKNSGINSDFFMLSKSDWLYIIILASVCTAYAFIAAVDVMKNISPFTVILSYNLEPVYGIILAILLFPDKEQMSTEFYIGALLILIVVVFDALVKQKRAKGLRS
ncbi:DMT family transporter [Winogradskyella aurantiaca]|uniref:DMT family transporter n=1 Tax=Winogradskyella aurantiaca TaxID=2219558 RepID=UPI000E1D0981|nr:DMT family transporter [Winogradskyella aurantiaca]